MSDKDLSKEIERERERERGGGGNDQTERETVRSTKYRGIRRKTMSTKETDTVRRMFNKIERRKRLLRQY